MRTSGCEVRRLLQGVLKRRRLQPEQSSGYGPKSLRKSGMRRRWRGLVALAEYQIP